MNRRSAIRDQIGHVAFVPGRECCSPKVRLAVAIGVLVIVDVSRLEAKERTSKPCAFGLNCRLVAEMPLADQAVVMPLLLSSCGKDVPLTGSPCASENLTCPKGASDPETLLIATRDQGGARRAADGGIGIEIRQLHAVAGQAVNVWRSHIR